MNFSYGFSDKEKNAEKDVTLTQSRIMGLCLCSKLNPVSQIPICF